MPPLGKLKLQQFKPVLLQNKKRKKFSSRSRNVACKATSTVPAHNPTDISQFANSGRFGNSSGDLEEDTDLKLLFKKSTLPLNLQFE